jgi:hypothetical protein
MSELTTRLREIVKAITEGNRNELTMRVPAEPKRDADLVISDAADLLDNYEYRLVSIRQAIHGFDMNTIDDPYEALEIIQKALRAAERQEQSDG